VAEYCILVFFAYHCIPCCRNEAATSGEEYVEWRLVKEVAVVRHHGMLLRQLRTIIHQSPFQSLPLYHLNGTTSSRDPSLAESSETYEGMYSSYQEWVGKLVLI